MTINDIFNTIADTSSKTAKEVLLKQNMSPVIEQILKDTYGGAKYYVKKYNINASGNLTIDAFYPVFHALLERLASRQLTGNAAVAAVEDTIGQFNTTDQLWLMRVLGGNLKIGIGQTFSEDTGTIKKYPCALANVLEQAKNIDIFDGNWLISGKLDGCRCHAHVDIDAGTVVLMSRQGKVFSTLDKVVPEVLSFLKGLSGRWVLDGEICIVDEYGDEDFRGLMSLVRRKDYTIENPRYKLFDILTEDEFWGKAQSRPFAERYQLIQSLKSVYISRDWIVDPIAQEWVTPESFEKWSKWRKEGGWEGLMVRKNVPYEGRRTNNLLKIKPFQDAEYVVTGVIEGDLTYNTTEGSRVLHGVSALTITHKGNTVKVGTGMTREQRLSWIDDPSQIIGKTITVQYFEETQDSKTGEYSLRFPVLKCVYDDKRDI